MGRRRVAVLSSCLLLLLAPLPSYAAKEMAPSPTNPWLGAQVGVKVAGTGEFPDRIGGAAQARVQTWKYRAVSIPLFGNVSKLATPTAVEEKRAILENLVQSSEGVYLRLVPNYQIGDPARAGVNLWASAGWHLTAVKDSTGESDELNEGRFSLGAEASFLPSPPGSQRPTTLSIEGVAHVADRAALQNAIARELRSFQSLELTGIIPIAESEVGVLVEGILSNHQVPSVWRVALVFAAAKTSK